MFVKVTAPRPTLVQGDNKEKKEKWKHIIQRACEFDDLPEVLEKLKVKEIEIWKNNGKDMYHCIQKFNNSIQQNLFNN